MAISVVSDISGKIFDEADKSYDAKLEIKLTKARSDGERETIIETKEPVQLTKEEAAKTYDIIRYNLLKTEKKPRKSRTPKE